jgi:hypothetical protein
MVSCLGTSRLRPEQQLTAPGHPQDESTLHPLDRAHPRGRPLRRRRRADPAEPHDVPDGHLRHLLRERDRRDRGPALLVRRRVPLIRAGHVQRAGRRVGDERLCGPVHCVHAHSPLILGACSRLGFLTHR